MFGNRLKCQYDHQIQRLVLTLPDVEVLFDSRPTEPKVDDPQAKPDTRTLPPGELDAGSRVLVPIDPEPRDQLLPVEVLELFQ